MFVEIMQVSIAISMLVQTGLTLRNAVREEKSQGAGAPKLATELKVEPAHAKENAAVPASAGTARETPVAEPSTGDADPLV